MWDWGPSSSIVGSRVPISRYPPSTAMCWVRLKSTTSRSSSCQTPIRLWRACFQGELQVAADSAVPLAQALDLEAMAHRGWVDGPIIFVPGDRGPFPEPGRLRQSRRPSRYSRPPSARLRRRPCWNRQRPLGGPGPHFRRRARRAQSSGGLPMPRPSNLAFDPARSAQLMAEAGFIRGSTSLSSGRAVNG